MTSEKHSHESRLSVGWRDSGEARRRASFNNTEYERSNPAPRTYRAGFVTRSSAPHLLQCQSPSTDSTTSLLQLREKLSVLSPIVFTKAPAKIAVTPELSAVKEQDELDRLSNSESRPRCGVAYRRQYHSDSEAVRDVPKKSTPLQPVHEEPSASLPLLVAALGPSDLSVINTAFEQLYRKTPHVDLGDLLIEEAIKHGQDKDSGIISGKATQDSDIVEDTPFEEPAHRIKLGSKLKPQHTEDNEYSTDDSDVVDDTPRCDYDWRKKVKTTSDKAHKINDYDSEALDDLAVDHYFCQQTHADLINLISPATVKEDSEDDCIVIDDIRIYAEEANEVELATDPDIVDCVNYLLDTVCYDLHNCINLHKKQEQEKDILGVTKINDNRSTDTRKISKMNKNPPKSTAGTLTEDHNDVPQSVSLKFKPKKQNTKMNAARQKYPKQNIHPNSVEKDSVLQKSTSTKSRTDNAKQLIRNKRKLYSPKDDDNENHDRLKSRKERRQSSSTESPIAACYKELENARKSRIRLPRKGASTQPVASPKTKKLNDMFDKIKDNVVNDEIITLVEKKSTKDLYNMSSESDDEAFKKKPIQVRKRVSSSSLESTSKNRRSIKPVDHTSYYSSEDEYKRAQKPKTVKQTKAKNRNVKKIRRPNLDDEKMRTKQSEVLETSFIQEKRDRHVPEVAEPALRFPALEEIPDDLIDETIISENKPVTPKKTDIIKIKTKKSFKKKYEKLTKPTITNKGKKIATKVAIERESETVSPLPGLVVETEPRKDDLTSLDAKFVQKLKNICTGVDELSTTRDTQNMLLMNTDGREVDLLSENGDRQDLSNNNQNLPNVLSEKSIPTCGSSPITGHNNPDESPPNLDAMHESFQHRDVSIEGKSSSIAEFLANMRNQAINIKAAANKTSPIIPITRTSTRDSARSNVSVTKQLEASNAKPIDTSSDVDSDKTEPRVILERLPSKIFTRISTTDSARSVLSAEKLPEKSHPKPKDLSSDARSDKTNQRALAKKSSEDIISLRNPVTSKSKTDSRVLSQLSPEKYGKIVTPNRSNTTASSVPILMLDRVSSDEINRWLPMPVTEEVVETPRSPIITRQRRPSVAKSCTACDSKISPVKLNFNIGDLIPARITRSKTRSMKSDRSCRNINKLRTESASRKDTGIEKSSHETANISNEEDFSETSRHFASVQSWIKRNAAMSKNTDDITAVKETLYQELMEALNTRQVEINEAASDAMQASFLKDQEDLARIVEDIPRILEESNARIVESIKALVGALKKRKQERACALVRDDAEKRANMLLLLEEDILRILK